MSQPTRVAIAGIGVIGRTHIENALQLQQEGLIKLVGLADVVIELAQKTAGPLNIPAFSSVEAMLDATTPQLLIVATPHPEHEDPTLAAAQRGIHVLCEKPIAHTLASADRMIAACQKAGVMLGIDFQQRTIPAHILAHQMIERGDLGELYHVSFIATGWYRTQAYYDSGGWRGTWDGEGGGVIMNQAPHHLDLYCWLAGLPQSIKAIALTRIHQIDVENTVSALLQHNLERVDNFYTTTAEWPGRNELIFTGQKGQIILAERQLRFYQLERSLGEELLTAPHGSKPAGSWQELTPPTPERSAIGHTAVLHRFAECIRDGIPDRLIATGDDGRRALEIANGMLLSAYTNTTITLPVDRSRYDQLLATLQQQAAQHSRKRHLAQPTGLTSLPEG